MRISKQSLHQLLERRMLYNEETGYLIQIIIQIRQDHPTLSCRALYYKINPQNLGRDKFEQLCRDYGFSMSNEKGPKRTTNSCGVVRFENLLQAFVLTEIDQAWSSDITYFEVLGHYYYITFVIDCYSRRILGHSTSKRLSAEETTLPALRMAIRTRRNKVPEGLIFHSDGGGQYYAKEFLSYTSQYKIKNSMCEMAYENGKAERINGTIKNNYLRHYKINSWEDLVKKVDQAVSLYNHERPHKSLSFKTPVQYEKDIIILGQQTKPMMRKSFKAKNQILGASSPSKSEQTKPQNQNVFSAN